MRHPNPRALAVAVSLLLVLGLAAVAAGASPTPAQESVARGAARNRAKAKAAAERRVATVNLPPGATVSPTRPAGVGGLLKEPIGIPAGHRQASAHRFWTVPEPQQKVLAWLRKHPPHRAKSVGEIGGTGGQALEFELLPGAPRSGDVGGLLFVDVVPRSSGGSAVRADAFVDWDIPRSPLARIPSGSHFLALTVAPGSGGLHFEGEPSRPTRHSSTTDPALIARLVRLANGLPANQEVGLPSCGPQGQGSEYHLITLKFRTAQDGRLLASVSQEIPFGLCDPMVLRLGGHGSYALGEGWKVLRAARGLIRRAIPSPS